MRTAPPPSHRLLPVVLASAAVALLAPHAGAQAAPAAAPPVQILEPARVAAAIRPILRDFHERAGFPGATIGYALRSGEAGSESVGVAFLDRDEPMGPTHRMMAGSAGKTFFAALALQLVAEGALELDEPIAGALGDEPWFPRLPNGGAITLRMLLNHTSGIPRYVMKPAFARAMQADPSRRWRPEELLEFVLDDAPLFAAGDGWAYADTNFIVAGMIIEKRVGDSCYNLIHERILRPRGLWDIVPTTSPDVLGLACGYVDPERNLFGLRDPAVVERGRYVFNPQFEWAGGGFASTPEALARWAAMLYGGDVLDAAGRRAMRATVAATLGPGSRYGLGMMERPSDHGPVLGHAGYFPGYLTDMAYYDDHGFALALQINTTTMSPSLNPSAMQRVLDACAAAILDRR